MAAQSPALEHPDIDNRLLTEILRVCREGDRKELRYILNYEKDVLKYFLIRTPKGYTAIHEAVDAEQPDIVQMLLLYGVSPNIRARGGITPLHLAASKASEGCVRALVDNGADITLKDDLGHEAMHKAEQRSSKKRETVVKLLRSKGRWSYLWAGLEIITELHCTCILTNLPLIACYPHDYMDIQ